jgi:hypothetical protein
MHELERFTLKTSTSTSNIERRCGYCGTNKVPLRTEHPFGEINAPFSSIDVCRQCAVIFDSWQYAMRTPLQKDMMLSQAVQLTSILEGFALCENLINQYRAEHGEYIEERGEQFIRLLVRMSLPYGYPMPKPRNKLNTPSDLTEYNYRVLRYTQCVLTAFLIEENIARWIPVLGSRDRFVILWQGCAAMLHRAARSTKYFDQLYHYACTQIPEHLTWANLHGEPLIMQVHKMLKEVEAA